MSEGKGCLGCAALFFGLPIFFGIFTIAKMETKNFFREWREEKAAEERRQAQEREAQEVVERETKERADAARREALREESFHLRERRSLLSFLAMTRQILT